ncbi:MAG: sulfotransferase [Pseudomonadales bacterium]|nr:sulfotransferase [Pseudomonadales bacterium]
MKGPVFLVGVDWSGTTLLSLILGSHSKIAIPYESKFITAYFRKNIAIEGFTDDAERRSVANSILAEPYVKDWGAELTVDDVDLTLCNDLSSTISTIYETYAVKKGKVIWGDKDPAYTTDIDILNKLFPDAKYIHIVRDGRDVALSIVKQ